MTDATWLDQLQWDDQGLIPAIAQDEKTAESGQAVYWSRSRARLWHKGESSGHLQHVSDIRTDCDSDVVLLKVTQTGGIACHTGRYSCFYRQLEHRSGLANWREAEPVIKDPGDIYPGDE